MQIAFEAPSQLVSTEKFLVPYVLEGEVRTFNQKMLERFEVRSRLVFFCVDERTAGWRFFDWRTRHTGPVDRASAGKPDGTALLTIKMLRSIPGWPPC